MVRDLLDVFEEPRVRKHVAGGLAVEQNPVGIDATATSCKHGALHVEERVGRGGELVVVFKEP